ncbi:MAG TPA: phosphoribosylamine--glycine ligase [Eubacteriales bacterium]|mgnify:CR=1 FL=1|nr:phosphoribosylamine--glycine ligase [Eubacteriales bacterium]
MKVMVVGGGGREHAIVKKLLENKSIEKIFVLPSNGGIDKIAIGIDIKAIDIDNIVNFAVKNEIDYAVVAQDDPLVLGLVDRLNQAGIDCFGPTKNAAIIEGSKVFAKNFMQKHNIPTAQYCTFDTAEEAVKYLKLSDFPVVIKADGVAAGKGVTIANDIEQAKDAVTSIMDDKIFGKSGDKIVIEEYMRGTEFTLLAFCDGETIKPMVSSMDHKKAFDGDMGLNTGGMGAIAPSPVYNEKIRQETLEKIVYPTLAAFKKEGIIFKGCLYFGLMATDKGVRVVEYNCRFGDPEAQVVLPLLKTDLFTVMKATTNGTLDKTEIEFYDKYACCVIMASKGYPIKYEKGYEIEIDEKVEPYIFYAGVKTVDNRLVTNGGRVLGVTAVEDSYLKAINKAYERVNKVKFENMFYRNDIGKRALQKDEE